MSNYDISQGLIQRNLTTEKDELLMFGDTSLVKSIRLQINDSVLALQPSKSGYYGTLNLHYHQFTGIVVLSLLGKGDTLICNDLHFPKGETIKYFFDNYFRRLRETKINLKKQPVLFISSEAFAAEAITGFLFGEIKPVSYQARFLRFIQIILTFFLGLILNKTVDKSKYIRLEKTKRYKELEPESQHEIEYHI